MDTKSICSDHPTVPLKGCQKCWTIEKNRRGHISCKFRICTSGSCKFRHDPYNHQPNLTCTHGLQCEIPWCGFIHPASINCGHLRPTPNCTNCQTEGLNKETAAKQKSCSGNCKFNSGNVCYFLHRDESDIVSDSVSESESGSDANPQSNPQSNQTI